MPAIATKEKSKMVSVKLDISTKNRLDRVASFHKRSPHYILKEMIGRHLNEEEKRMNDLHEAQESLLDYETTGLHITFEEFNDWADAIKINHNTPVPVCHI